MTIEELKAKVKECRNALETAQIELLKARIGNAPIGTIIQDGEAKIVFTRISADYSGHVYAYGHVIKKDGDLYKPEREISEYHFKPIGMYDKPIPPEYL